MSQVRVHSLQAIRDFRALLVSVTHDFRQALGSVDLEVRRSMDWVCEEQPAYWKHEVRRSEDRVLQAKKDLYRCRSIPLPGGGQPACMEEKKALDRAVRRLEFCREQVEITRNWGQKLKHEVTEYDGRSNQLEAMLDGDMARAIAFLDHAIVSIEAYLAERGPVDPRESTATASVARGDAVTLGEDEASAAAKKEQPERPAGETAAPNSGDDHARS